MARSNGPFGPPLRRRPGEDPFGAPPAQPQWPPQPQGYGDHAPAPQAMQNYQFPPPEPAYGYSNQPLLAQQQWSQQGDGQGYDLNYQSYPADDPPPFQHTAHRQQHGYSDAEADYSDEYYEDEEPRRGKRWFLIAAALVGAIGVGGALAYTYRSLIAPNVRVPLVKADPNVKVRPEQRSADKKLPTRLVEEPKAAADPAEEPSAENQGPRAVKTIPITPGAAPPAAEAPPPSGIPGISIYKPPQLPAAAAPPPVQQAATVQAAPKVQPSQSGRVAIGTRPPAAEPDDDPAEATPPPLKKPPPQIASVAPKVTPSPKVREASSGLGFVAVLSSQKSSMEALQVYADLREKYPDVLGDKTPDVQEADLSARGLGMMYRLVVGPPGSHNAATGVCTRLKTAGYQGCWVKEY